MAENNRAEEDTVDDEIIEQKVGEDAINSKKINKQNRSQAIRRLIIFQFKLMLDAIRDLALSPVSLLLSIMDIVKGQNGRNSYFQKLMVFGQNTDRKINLFEQHDSESDSIDTILNQVESVIVKEYKNHHLSKKTYSALEKIINSSHR